MFARFKIMTKEELRLQETRDFLAHWKRWGPYLSERAWGTVREDYSPDGNAWDHLPHDHARSRAYRWNEDGLAGICDRHQRICLAIALWNGKDSILKERLFGVSGHEGNHGEDVKECYYYLDNTPTHSYMKYLYKYPQAPFPYSQLVAQNHRRGRNQPEWELADSGVFDEGKYFDVLVEYAKASPEDIVVRITAANRGHEPACLHVLPTIWFRNTWSWSAGSPRPRLWQIGDGAIELEETSYGHRWLYCDACSEMLFTENETNLARLYGGPKRFAKDAFHAYVVEGCTEAVNPARSGTKAAAHYVLRLASGEEATVRLRLTDQAVTKFDESFERIFTARQCEAEEFYATIIPSGLSHDGRNVMRQSLAGLLWSKQFYHYIVREWIDGDPAVAPAPGERRRGRNHEWTHLHNADVLSMPDKWEYPWYAAWDLAFQCVPLALVDPDFAKEQLMLMVREWYMHPNGQIPAYEWALGDVNPPVQAWAAWRVYSIEKRQRGWGDRTFLQRIFHKLLLNFTWWVNRKDADGLSVFQGGFLGLDNICVIDRNAPFPGGGRIEQADGTGWMAMYCLNLMAIALELAVDDPAYEDVASKFWEHFIYIANAMNHLGNDGVSMWSEEDGFFYDVLRMPSGEFIPLKLRSIVGLIPLFAVETLDAAVIDLLPGFKRRLEWFIEHRKDLTTNVACMQSRGPENVRLLSILRPEQLTRVLRVVLDEKDFLSPFGVRALSRVHEKHPYVLSIGGSEYRVDYEPGESRTGILGGNSNWRGPVWFPLNYLLIQSLRKLHHYFQDGFHVECPTGSGTFMNLSEVADEISRRLTRIFLCGQDGRRPAHGANSSYRDDPHWRDLVLFYEYFHGDTGCGMGASHQTGWTALVATLLQQDGRECASTGSIANSTARMLVG
jgi:hypothetical protein